MNTARNPNGATLTTFATRVDPQGKLPCPADDTQPLVIKGMIVTGAEGEHRTRIPSTPGFLFRKPAGINFLKQPASDDERYVERA
jgi:hypothetical protein